MCVAVISTLIHASAIGCGPSIGALGVQNSLKLPIAQVCTSLYVWVFYLFLIIMIIFDARLFVLSFTVLQVVLKSGQQRPKHCPTALSLGP